MAYRRGSITIFTTIALLLISASIFILLEGARYQNLNYLADLQTDVAIDGALANYNSNLWDCYHLLGVDYSSAKEIIYQNSKADTVSLTGYTRLTDGNGKVFINSVSSYMKRYLVYEVIKEIYSQYESVKAVTNSSQMDTSQIEEAIENIEALEETEETSQGTAEEKNTDEKKTVLSILESAKRWLSTGLLELVLEDISSVSEAEYEFKNGVLERSLKVGKNFVQEEVSWEDRILLQQYLRTYMSHYKDTKPERVLNYEVEYLLGEKQNDKENLQVVVSKLLFVREAANYLHLISSPQKLTKVDGMATLIAGVSLNPIVINVVKIGLLTAWALAESILDVRALLNGKRIAFIKSEDSWTTEFDDIEGITNGFAMAKECSSGMRYEDYLGIFLLLEREEDVAMRALQIQEVTIQKKSSDVSFRIDTLITQAEVSAWYSYEPIFPFLGIMKGLNDLEHKIFSKRIYGYY